MSALDLNELARAAAEAEVERLHAGERAGRALDEADAAALAATEANRKLHDALEMSKAEHRLRLTNGRGTKPEGRFYESPVPTAQEEA